MLEGRVRYATDQILDIVVYFHGLTGGTGTGSDGDLSWNLGPDTAIPCVHKIAQTMLRTTNSAYVER